MRGWKGQERRQRNNAPNPLQKLRPPLQPVFTLRQYCHRKGKAHPLSVSWHFTCEKTQVKSNNSTIKLPLNCERAKT